MAQPFWYNDFPVYVYVELSYRPDAQLRDWLSYPLTELIPLSEYQKQVDILNRVLVKHHPDAPKTPLKPTEIPFTYDLTLPPRKAASRPASGVPTYLTYDPKNAPRHRTHRQELWYVLIHRLYRHVDWPLLGETVVIGVLVLGLIATVIAVIIKCSLL